jgi:hypothetical protein
MAVIQKTLFAKNLDKYSVLVNDTDPNSKYFKVTELPDTLTGGKNAFLIAGSDLLVADTKILIEIKSSDGKIIYNEPGEGYISSSLNGVPFTTEYYEGVSKVVSVYVYPDTSFGECTITILGEVNQYEDGNGILTPIPLDWEGKYNVKWQKTINVNPSLANTTKIRFYERPTAKITEILSPIYRIISGSKVDSGTNQSFANIKLSKLETFAGDVKRVKVFRTSQGDISDYDLIQDILVESKELLTSYGLSGSVVGNTGIFTSETLKNYWNTSSLNVYLTSSRIESGIALNGSGLFTYTSSLDIKSTNTYELNLDVFYSASISTNLGIYLVSGSTSSSIATLNGTAPTKNLSNIVIPFKIDTDYPSASLYFSQSQGEWHLGNISLKLSQDTAFSPDEISFVTTMPTIIGNETYNFKFEFYDVNNNYVPVAATQSATFTGGTNTSNTNLLISASLSQSLAALAIVSSSISGTVTSNSSSFSSSVHLLTGSISSSLSSSYGYTSASVTTLSSSVNNSIILTSGSITLLSGSFINLSSSVSGSIYSLSGSLSSSLYAFSSSLSSSTYNTTSQSLYQVYSASQYLDTFIFTDQNGKVNQPPTASSPGLYLGSTYLGYYSGSGTAGWKTYMDNQGDFYLTSSVPGGGLLAWNASSATLQINGSINIQGGNAATTSSLNSATASLLGSINSATASLSSSLAPNIFTTTTGLINRPPTVLVSGTSGLYLGSTYLGYYNGSDWKTYMANNGNFYLSGAGTDSLSWASGVLTINGAINITGGNVQTSLSNINSATSSLNSSITNINTATSSLDARIFTNSSGLVNKTPSASTSGLYLGSTFLGYYNGSAWKTYMDNAGKFYLSGTGTNGLSWDGITLSIQGTLKVADGTGVASSTDLSTGLSGKINTGAAASDVNSNTTTISGGKIRTGTIESTGYAYTSGNFSTAGMQINLDNGLIRSKNFGISTVGDAFFKGDITGASGTFSGTVNVGGTDLTTANTLNANTTAGNVGLGNVENLSAQNQAQTGLIAGTTITGGGITLSGGGNIKGGQTAYNTGTGFFLGYSGTAYKFSIGDASTKGITWDGNALSIGGDVTIGATLASTVVSNAAAVSGKISTGGAASDVNSGVTKISGGQITADTITATQISSLNFTGKTATFDKGNIGGWELAATTLKSTDSVTILDSTNKEFAVMDSNNLSYYKARVGAGNTFLSQPNNPFSEMNALGVRVSGGSSTSGYGIFANLQGYNDPVNSTRGTSVSIYSTIDYTINQFVPCYTILQENASGVDTTVSALQTEGGAYLRNSGNTSVTGVGKATNQGFALIVEGKTYLGGGYTGNGPMVYIAPASMRLDPSNPGTNYTLKIIQSTGEVFRSSSSRTKKNILGKWSENTNVLDKIKVTPVEKFRYKSWEDKRPEFYTIGLIAEDLHDNGLEEAVIYELDKYNKPTNIPETIDYEKISSILWKGMQELLERVENLETQLKNK